jgi:hypothetical protein
MSPRAGARMVLREPLPESRMTTQQKVARCKLSLPDLADDSGWLVLSVGAPTRVREPRRDYQMLRN